MLYIAQIVETAPLRPVDQSTHSLRMIQLLIARNVVAIWNSENQMSFEFVAIKWDYSKEHLYEIIDEIEEAGELSYCPGTRIGPYFKQSIAVFYRRTNGI